MIIKAPGLAELEGIHRREEHRDSDRPPINLDRYYFYTDNKLQRLAAWGARTVFSIQPRLLSREHAGPGRHRPAMGQKPLRSVYPIYSKLLAPTRRRPHILRFTRNGN